ncbi:MAG: hypothetical protein MJ098_05790 [Saccharofermentans sp.]|nr:hypothetical protein [Saccharofermentans sp.]
MSPFDMLVLLFFALVTIKAVSTSIDYWKDVDDECAYYASRPAKPATRATVSRTVKTVRAVRPSSVKVTPIKRVDTPAVAKAAGIYKDDSYIHLKDKGAA